MAKSRSRGSRSTEEKPPEAAPDLLETDPPSPPEDDLPPPPPENDDDPSGDSPEDADTSKAPPEPEAPLALEEGEVQPTEAELKKAKERDDNTKELRASKAARAAGKPVTKLPTREPVMAVRRAFQGRARDPVVMAFMRQEQLGRTRKMTLSEWKAEFEKFKTAKR